MSESLQYEIWVFDSNKGKFESVYYNTYSGYDGKTADGAHYNEKICRGDAAQKFLTFDNKLAILEINPLGKSYIEHPMEFYNSARWLMDYPNVFNRYDLLEAMLSQHFLNEQCNHHHNKTTVKSRNPEHSEAIKAGLRRAQENGVHVGRPRKSPAKMIDEYPHIVIALTKGEPVLTIVRKHGVSRSTVYKVQRAMSKEAKAKPSLPEDGYLQDPIQQRLYTALCESGTWLTRSELAEHCGKKRLTPSERKRLQQIIDMGIVAERPTLRGIRPTTEVKSR